MNVEGIVRAVRRMRRLSQRELAEIAKLPTSTIDRLESGYTRDPRLGTLEAIFSATGYSLVVVNEFGRVLNTDYDHDGLRDRAWRRFPAHLEIEPVIGELRDGWWGWRRIAWVRDDPGVPGYSYIRRRQLWEDPWYADQRWDDAT